MRGDTKAAVAFLLRWSPTGPWVLSAIHPSQQSFKTRAFTSIEAARDWIEEHNGEMNLYFQVNSVIEASHKKPNRENIKSMDWLHIDIDPRAGEDVASEQKRILSLLTDKLPDVVPPPTVVVFSGGGYQGYWKLEEPFEINGVLEEAEEAKRFNQQLEFVFGADSCHNLDRIMRLPGTVNIPGTKKAKRGREEALAELVFWEESRVYPLDRFQKAPKVEIIGDTFTNSKTTVQVTGNVQRYDTDDLDEWDIPQRVKVVIAQGQHPDQPKEKDNSRSAWLFDAVCEMVRRKVPDEVIFSIITDPEFGISESVLDKGANAEKYALKQIRSAKEFAIDPNLAKMNSQFAVVENVGGRCRVIEETFDPSVNRFRITEQGFDDFKNRFLNQKIPVGGDKFMSLGHWWLQHPERMQYSTVVFAPDQEIPGAYNLWKGFSCAPNPEGDCSLFLDHIKHTICSGNDENYEYLIRWMARAVQLPAKTGEVAIVLQGERGTGKSIFAKVFGRLFGRHFMEISNASHLVGQFNAHLQDIVVLFADEAFFAGDRKHASVLKNLITSDTLTLEKKFRDAEQAANCVHLIMASNDEHVIPAGEYERRFLMLRVNNEHRQDTEYFKRLLDQMEEGGYGALLHYLRSIDITGFNVRKVPNTQSLQEQKLLSMPPEGEWWYQLLASGNLPLNYTWGGPVPKSVLIDNYLEHTERFHVPRRSTETALGLFFKKVGLRHESQMWMNLSDGSGNIEKKRVRVVEIPNLQRARAAFEALYGDIAWPKEETEEESPL